MVSHSQTSRGPQSGRPGLQSPTSLPARPSWHPALHRQARRQHPSVPICLTCPPRQPAVQRPRRRCSCSCPCPVAPVAELPCQRPQDPVPCLAHGRRRLFDWLVAPADPAPCDTTQSMPFGCRHHGQTGASKQPGKRPPLFYSKPNIPAHPCIDATDAGVRGKPQTGPIDSTTYGGMGHTRMDGAASVLEPCHATSNPTDTPTVHAWLAFDLVRHQAPGHSNGPRTRDNPLNHCPLPPRHDGMTPPWTYHVKLGTYLGLEQARALQISASLTGNSVPPPPPRPGS